MTCKMNLMPNNNKVQPQENKKEIEKQKSKKQITVREETS